MFKKNYATKMKIIGFLFLFLTLFILVGCSETTIAVNSVTLDIEEATLRVGITVSVIATINPENATVQEIVWRTSDASIAIVSDDVITVKHL